MNAKWLTTPKENVQQLQEKLGHGAKENKKRRFHALYDKVYRMDILWEAWRRVRANKGSAGIDGKTVRCGVRRERWCESEKHATAKGIEWSTSKATSKTSIKRSS